MRALGSSAILCLALLAPSSAFADEAACLGPATTEHVRALLGGGEPVDAHLAAQMLLLLCPDAPDAVNWRLLDALALVDLDEATRARALLQPLADGPETALARRAAVLWAWSYLHDRDAGAFAAALARLPPPAQNRLQALADLGTPRVFAADALRLDPPLGDRARAAYADYAEAMHTRRPWLAGLFSAVLPGAGQAYAGSWQGAAVAFVLNGVLIGSTAELAVHRLYFSAGAVGLAASIFYVGGIFNAADLSQRRDEATAEPARRQLEQFLVPEALPDGP